jgi:ZIP family zinc transporter
MIIILISIGAFLATFLGGILALRFKDRLHLVLGFSAGALIGVAFFDLLPEAIELAAPRFDVPTITSCVALGFVVFMIIDRFIAPHHGTDDHCENKNHRGRVGAGGLSFHSFLDGLAIGLAFQVSSAVGVVVTVAVLVHDFSDGINTIGLILKNGGSKKQAMRWLFIDAIAPVIGVLVSTFIVLSGPTLGIILAIFCGFFLYLGASDLLPESHHQHPTLWTTFMTVIGVLVLFFAIKLAGI